MGKKDEMTLEVVQKEQNKILVTKQTKEGPFQRLESIQEFQSSGSGNTTTKTTTTTTTTTTLV